MESAIRSLRMVEQAHDPSDFYRLAPYGALVGRPVDELEPIADLDGATARIAAAASYRDVRPDTGRLPAMLRARLSGVDDGYVAVALNGTIAGVGPTFHENDQLEAAAMLNPDYFRAGKNTVTVYRVSGNPASPTLEHIGPGS